MFTFHEGVTCSLIGAPHPPCLLQEQKPLSHARTNKKNHSVSVLLQVLPAASHPLRPPLLKGLQTIFSFEEKAFRLW
jgi:hypothetical protein